MTLEDILTTIEGNVPNVTDALYTLAVSHAGNRFFGDSCVWLYGVDPISLSAGVRRYDVDAPRGCYIKEFANVYYNDSEIYSDTRAQLLSNTCPYKYDRKAETILLYPTPSSSEANAIVIEAVLVPDLREDTPRELDYYLAKYGEAIVAAACVYLCKMPNKNWTNNVAAGNYEAEYQSKVEMARQEGKGFGEKRIMTAKYEGY